MRGMNMSPEDNPYLIFICTYCLESIPMKSLMVMSRDSFFIDLALIAKCLPSRSL